MKLILLALVILAGAGAVSPAPAHAQGTAYAEDGRPQFCALFDAAISHATSTQIVGTVVDDLGYSRVRGAGRLVMNDAQRVMGWLGLLYSQNTLPWAGYDAAYWDIADAVQMIIREYDGNVPALVRREHATFNRAAIGCRSSIRA